MSLVDRMFGRVRQESFVFEATWRCNHDCLHCYNVWKNKTRHGQDARGTHGQDVHATHGRDAHATHGQDVHAAELPTGETLAMLGAMLDQTGARLVSLSGGEPLLRPDIFEIVDFLRGRGAAVNLITNGSLLDDAAIGRLAGGRISVFEVPLLSCQRAVHDRMSGSPGAFDKATLAIASLKAAGQTVVAVFVATKLNIATWRETAELAVALGADGIMLNRFNPGGRGAENIELLQAGPAELRAVLDAANAVSEQYGVSISCSIAMPPCLFDHAAWPRLSFGFCAAGTKRAYYTLDPWGNVRPCNHSALVLGNIGRGSFASMARSRAMREFMRARPGFCAGCRMERTCQGGCKAAAEVCRGSPWEMDPFLAAYAAEARKVS